MEREGEEGWWQGEVAIERGRKGEGEGGSGLKVVGRERALGAAADATKKGNKRRSRLRE